METLNHLNTRAGTLGGTLTGVFINLHAGDITRTVVLGALGAVVSFAVSYLLGYITRKRK